MYLTHGFILPKNSAQTDPSKILNNIVASWAWAQTAASFSPALSQVGYPRPANLANSIVGMHQLQQKGQHKLQQETEELERKQRSEEHQRQLRSAYEEQKQKEVQRQLQAAYENERQKVEATEKAVSPSTFPSSHSTSHTPSEVTPAQQLFRSYAAHLESLKEKERRESSKSKPMFVEDEKKLPTADQPIRKTRLSASAASKSEVLPSSNAENLWSNGREDGCSIAAGMEESCDGATLKDIKSVQSDYEQQRRAEGDEACGTEDEEAGTILWGFLNSLRESYEDAVEQKANSSSANDAKVRLTLLEEEKYSKKQKKSSRPSGKPRTSISPTSSSSSTELPEMLKPAKRAEKRSRDTGSSGETEKDASVQITPAPRFRATSSRIPPASITDTSTLSRSEISSGASSQPTEFSSSSLEDSDCKSDKTDPSSSEESEKDCTLLNRGASKGPPRKRLKACKPVEKVKEFTTQNLMEHSKRMSQEFDDAENGNY